MKPYILVVQTRLVCILRVVFFVPTRISYLSGSGVSLGYGQLAAHPLVDCNECVPIDHLINKAALARMGVVSLDSPVSSSP